MDDLS
jgi:hypothetical protein